MTVKQQIEATLAEALAPAFMEVIDESHQHSGPADAQSHFKVVLVADAFAALPAVKRHQRVYALLAEQLAAGVHALALHLYSPEEWQARGAAPASPACMGGSKGQ